MRPRADSQHCCAFLPHDAPYLVAAQVGVHHDNEASSIVGDVPGGGRAKCAGQHAALGLV
jgi:hypothetical protein